jgi:hypothetical protein
VAWVETHSLSFAARHEADDAECAQRTLDDLEDMRLRLEERFEQAPGGITVVVHPAAAWLSAAHPFLPAARWAAAPAGRRYLAGWAMSTELHVLNDDYMDRRAAGEDSRRALRGTADKWAWLIEGASQYYAGQIPHFRAAVIRRMREGGTPSFPPSAREAIILGGTIFDVLERSAGPDACDLLVSRLRKDGARGNLELAFDEPIAEIEREWRRYLREEVARSGPTRLLGASPSLDTEATR